MGKHQEEQEVEKKIGQLQNRQKILLNRKRSEEHRARTHRLIGHGAILEAVFPAVVGMEGDEVKAFLIALSRPAGVSRPLHPLEQRGANREIQHRPACQGN